MTINSKNKGKNGELELVHLLKELGFEESHRSQQFSGKGESSADVVGLDGIHIECKRVEKLNIDEAMEQAIRDSEGGNLPTVFHRRNRKKWKVTMLLEDWVRLYKAWGGGTSSDK